MKSGYVVVRNANMSRGRPRTCGICNASLVSIFGGTVSVLDVLFILEDLRRNNFYPVDTVNHDSHLSSAKHIYIHTIPTA